MAFLSIRAANCLKLRNGWKNLETARRKSVGAFCCQLFLPVSSSFDVQAVYGANTPTTRERRPKMEFELKTAIPILERTPVVLEGLLNGLPTEWTAMNEGPGSWTVHEILAHLIHAERDDWIRRVRHLLEWGTTKPFTPFDRTFGFEAARGQPVEALTSEFARSRRESVDALTALRLTNADLGREGLHPEFGHVRLGQHLATWVAHDFTHLSQITRVMAAQYREAVGPWAAYLRIVRPLAAN